MICGILDGWVFVRRESSSGETAVFYVQRVANSEKDGVSRFRQHHSQCMAVSQDGNLLVTRSGEGTIHTWDSKTGEPIGLSLPHIGGAVFFLAANFDGIASGSAEAIRIWDARTGTQMCCILNFEFRCVAMSVDGRLVASGSDDNVARIWNAKTGEQFGTSLVGHGNRVNCVSFSGDGQYVASGSADNAARVRNVATGQQVGLSLEGHTPCVLCIAIGADERRVVSGS